MKKVIIVPALLVMVTSCMIVEGSVVKEYVVSISEKGNVFEVQEKITVENSTNPVFYVWIQDDGKNVNMKLDGEDVSYGYVDDKYSIEVDNLSSFNLSINYIISKKSRFLNKKILSTCEIFSIYKDGELLSKYSNLSESSFISIDLWKIKEEANYFLYTTILFVIVSVMAILYAVRPKKRKKEISNPDILREEKNILMNALKDLEKRYRNKEIREDVYGKLKEKYKKEIVDIVRKLEILERSE